MSDARIPPMLTGTVPVRYPLPPGSTVLVAPGAAVAAGDALAYAPRPPQWVAVTARPGDDRRGRPHVGAHVVAGESLAKDRRGFRAPVVAPAGGTIARVAPDGVAIIAPDGDAIPLHARHPGTVAAIAAGGIILAVPACRVRFAYAIGHPDAEIAITATTPRGGDRRGRTGTRLLPFIADRKGFAAALHESGGTLIVGAVADAVAWELCTRGNDSADTGQVAVIVLVGPGDVAHGERAVRQLQALAPRVAIIDRAARTLALVRHGAVTDAAATEPAPEYMRRDPAHWMEPATSQGVPRLTTIAGGGRVWTRIVASGSRGAHEVPTQNLSPDGICP